jgi:HK97 family phage major capsid protein
MGAFGEGALQSAARARFDSKLRELAGLSALLKDDDRNAKPEFSLVRAIEAMTPRAETKPGFLPCIAYGLHDGYEAEVCQEAARAAGVPYDANRIVVPWPMLQTRALSVAASGGGYLVETENLAPADILRPWSATLNAGMQVVENLTGNATVPKTTATTTNIVWQSSETAQVTPGAPTLGQVAFTPKTARAVVNVSRNFRLQSRPEDWLRRELLRTAATIVDQAALNGSGGAQPIGVLNSLGVGSQSGTALAWAGVLHMKALAATANAQDGTIGFISTPGVREVLEGRERASGNGGFIWQDNAIAGCSAYATTDMPAATMVSGPWSQVLFALWGGGITVELNPNDPTLFKSGVVQVAVVVSCDVGVLCDPVAFVKSATIT